mgnify:CR=1 FL=1
MKQLLSRKTMGGMYTKARNGGKLMKALDATRRPKAMSPTPSQNTLVLGPLLLPTDTEAKRQSQDSQATARRGGRRGTLHRSLS